MSRQTIAHTQMLLLWGVLPFEAMGETFPAFGYRRSRKVGEATRSHGEWTISISMPRPHEQRWSDSGRVRTGLSLRSR